MGRQGYCRKEYESARGRSMKRWEYVTAPQITLREKSIDWSYRSIVWIVGGLSLFLWSNSTSWYDYSAKTWQIKSMSFSQNYFSPYSQFIIISIAELPCRQWKWSLSTRNSIFTPSTQIFPFNVRVIIRRKQNLTCFNKRKGKRKNKFPYRPAIKFGYE